MILVDGEIGVRNFISQFFALTRNINSTFIESSLDCKNFIFICGLVVMNTFYTDVDSQELLMAKPESVGLSSEKLNLIKKSVQSFVDQKKIAGATTVVARRGKIAHLETYGFRNIESNKKMNLDSIYRIYSMTKPITSVAVMMLYEKGKIELNKPVSSYAPEIEDFEVYISGSGAEIVLQKNKREMTITDLLTHTSGLIYGWEGSPIDFQYQKLLYADYSHSEMINEFKDLALRYHPGEKWAYGLSTDLLGYIIEQVSGQSLADFFKENIFLPLMMKDTDFYVPKEKVERLATIYVKENEELKSENPMGINEVSKLPKILSGGAGLYTTVSDYMRFAQMILNKGQLDGIRLLSEETVELMVKNHISADVDFERGRKNYMLSGFGLGFGIWSRGIRGWAGIANTYFFIDFETDIVSMIWTQLRPSGAYPMLVLGFNQLITQAIID